MAALASGSDGPGSGPAKKPKKQDETTAPESVTKTPTPDGPPAPAGDYDASSITVLEGLAAVRKRPAMYIGDVTTRGLHHLVFELVDNAIDEAMAGHCHAIHIRIRPDGAVSVEDDGRGIPVDMHKTEKVAAVELVFGKLHAGGKFDHNAYKVSGGLHGVGASVVNALSEWLEVEICRDGKVHHMTFRRGAKASELKVLGATSKRGTKVTFKPDHEIFTDTTYVQETLAKRLRELAYLLGSRGLSITITDERTGQGETFRFEKGLATFIENLNQNKAPAHASVIHINKEIDKLVVEVALQYNDGYHEDVYCFANNINTHEGGTHLSGFRSALTRTLNAYAKKEGLVKDNETPPTGEDFREGLAAVISVLVPDPLFESQTKVKLGNAEVEGAVQTVVNEQLGIFLEEHPGEAKSIVSKALLAMRAREAARKQRDLVRKSAMVGGGLPGKLADCQTRKAEDAEIFLVEGDSAGGSAKQARDRRTQAILPLRGKILNVEKARLDKMLAHEEIRTIITALGTSIGADDFDIAKLRYGKVIVMTDADVDGSHIRTLLLTFFYRQMRPLVDAGKIYCAAPPLYRIKHGRHEEYVHNEETLAQIKSDLGLRSARLTLDGRAEPFAGDALKLLLGQLHQLEHHASSLERRGASLRELVAAGNGNPLRLPQYRVLSSGARPAAHHFADERALNQFLDAERSKKPDLSVSYEGDEQADVRVTAFNDRADIEQTVSALSSVGISLDHAFGSKAAGPSSTAEPATPFTLELAAGNVALTSLRAAADAIRKEGERDLEIQRYKGLGEMNPEQLWESTMDPAKRTMYQVRTEDAIRADEMFTILMGEEVEPRRAFIEKHALEVRNLDV